MAEYIDREKVFEILKDIYDSPFGPYDLSYYDHYEEIKTMIAEIPAADVRPVVRGKDCVYAHSAKGVEKLMCYRLGSNYPREAVCKTCQFGAEEDAAWGMYHLCFEEGGDV